MSVMLPQKQPLPQPRTATSAGFWIILAKTFTPKEILADMERIEILESEIKAKQWEVKERLARIWTNYITHT